MCIAIFKPAGKTIEKDRLAQCFKANPDGAGFMVAKNKELIILKGFFTFDEFWEAYQPYENEVAAIHFRIRTHGAIDVENCHPFAINKSLGFIHNGIISGFGLEKTSDTHHFNQMILKPLVNKYGNNILVNPSVKYLIESKIGYSKFVVLDRHGNHSIFNKDKGNWNDEVWYSNYSYKPYVAPVSNINYGGYTTGYKQSTSLVPTTTPTSKAFRTVKVGDLVVLLSPHYDKDSKTLFKKGELLEVISVNKDYTIDAMAEDNAFVYNLSYVKFDFIDDEEDTPADTIVAGPLDYAEDPTKNIFD